MSLESETGNTDRREEAVPHDIPASQSETLSSSGTDFADSKPLEVSPMQSPHYNYSAPFSQAEAQMPKSSGGGKAVLWAVMGAVGALVVIGLGYVIFQSLQDPYRTLDVFPTPKYLDDFQSVVGSRFRAEVTVDAELGGSFEKGRLLSFRESSSQKSLVVLVPPSLSQIAFSKGQSYVTELEVGQGGLIQAHGFKKK